MTELEQYKKAYATLVGRVDRTITKLHEASAMLALERISLNLAADELKKTALNLSKPAGVRLNIFALDKALEQMAKVETLNENSMMIFGNTATLRKFCEAYPKCKEVNGGIANKENSKQYAGAVFLNETEQADTQKILDLGVKIFMQQTPGHKRENLTRV